MKPSLSGPRHMLLIAECVVVGCTLLGFANTRCNKHNRGSQSEELNENTSHIKTE